MNTLVQEADSSKDSGMTAQDLCIHGKSRDCWLKMYQCRNLYLALCVVVHTRLQSFNLHSQDYPYGIGFWDVHANIAGLEDADFLSVEEKEAVFSRNAQNLWNGKIPGL